MEKGSTKLTVRNINELIKQYCNKRYGTKNDRMVQKYTEMAQRVIKSEEMRCSLDFIAKLECNLLLCILTDFTMLSTIQLYSDKYGPKEIQKFEESQRRGNKRVTPQDFMLKHDLQGGGKSQEKKCSQNHKINSLILPAIIKNIQISKALKTISIVHYKFHPSSWEEMGKAIGLSRTLTSLILNVCNLGSGNNLDLLMNGIIENNTLEKLDLSDNEIQDEDALGVVRYIKRQAEQRDSALWMTGLRHSKFEEKSTSHHKSHATNTGTATGSGGGEEQNQVLNLILSPNSPYQIQNQQRLNRYNQRKQKIKYRKGLREIILRRNKLGDNFADSLCGCLKYDKYIKVLDISNNKIQLQALKNLIKFALTENSSLITFDARENPGCTEKCKKQIALCLLKNIEQMRKQGIEIREEQLKPEILTFKIPNRILEGLGIQKSQGSMESQSFYMAPQTNKSPSIIKSSTLKSSNKIFQSKSRNDRQKSLSKGTVGFETSVSKTNNDVHNFQMRKMSQSQKKSQSGGESNSPSQRKRPQSFAGVKKNLLFKSQQNTTTSKKKQPLEDSKRKPQQQRSRSNSNQKRKHGERSQQKQSSSQQKEEPKIQQKKIEIPQITQQRASLGKSSSFAEFQINNLNKSSKKIDFSIVEQRIEPIEIFTNLSECDMKEIKNLEKKANSRQDRHASGSTHIFRTTASLKCDNCKQIEKEYFKTESKYLKSLDKINKLRERVIENEEEILYLANSGSLLPQNENDLKVVKQVAQKEPERIVSRLDYLMTELNFLLDIINFQKIDPKYKGLIQQHMFQCIDIANDQQLLQDAPEVLAIGQQLPTSASKNSQNQRKKTAETSQEMVYENSQELEKQGRNENKGGIGQLGRSLGLTDATTQQTFEQKRNQAIYLNESNRSEPPIDDVDSVQLLDQAQKQILMGNNENKLYELQQKQKNQEKNNNQQSKNKNQILSFQKQIISSDFEDYPQPYEINDDFIDYGEEDDEEYVNHQFVILNKRGEEIK